MAENLYGPQDVAKYSDDENYAVDSKTDLEAILSIVDRHMVTEAERQAIADAAATAWGLS